MKAVEVTKWDLQTTSTVIIGAGFSNALSQGKMPLMATYFDQLNQDDWPDLFEFVASVKCDPRTANIECQ